MRRRSGYTLVEMAVTLALVGVTSALVISWSGQWLTSARISSASGELMTSIWLARSEAVKRRGRVVLCKSADASVCTNLGGWEQGWIVFHDANNDRIRQGAEPVLSRQPAFPAGTQVSGNPAVSNYVSYGPAGSTFQAGTLTVCEKSANEGPAKQIIIAAGGRARLHTTRVAECP